MNSSMIFLETSIQIRRILEERLEQNKVEAQIRQLTPTVCTSAYVWMEFQRTVFVLVRYMMHIYPTVNTTTALIKSVSFNLSFLGNCESLAPYTRLLHLRSV